MLKMQMSGSKVLGSCCLGLILAVLVLGSARMEAQICTTADDMDVPTRTSLENAAQRFFTMAQQGDTATMQNAAIASLASNFGSVATAVNDAKPYLAGTQPTVRGAYLLDSTGTDQKSNQAFSGPAQQSERTEFFCGIYNSPDRVAFVFNQLPPGKYGVVIMSATNGTAPYQVSLILKQENGQWKLAGFFPKAQQVAGHDAAWFVIQARQYKQKGQYHDAWFYYQLAFDLMQPFPAMNAPTLDKLYDEMQQVQPSDLPLNGPVDVSAGARVFKVSAIFPLAVGDAIDLVVRYQASDLSDRARVDQDNRLLIRTLLAKYPEFREAFTAVVARAVAPTGEDFGTLMTTKEVK